MFHEGSVYKGVFNTGLDLAEEEAEEEGRRKEGKSFDRI